MRAGLPCGQWTFLPVLVLLAVPAKAGSPTAIPEEFPAYRPRIALIIDDLGNLGPAGERTIRLPGPVACAILPHTPYARAIARQAHAAGKEVLLHLPLQPVEAYQPLGMGTIGLDTTRAQLARILEADLGSVPYAVGINSHMGSLITRHPGHMRWLMGELKARGDLFFVDSYTTAASVALQLAREQGVPALRRDVFLDGEPEPAAIERAFQRLKALAGEQGFALGIGHPYPQTLEYLERVLPHLGPDGYELVPVSRLVSN
jgi:polysaccharide deacetylase 2 family uncharacterized protein YibQ